MDPFLFVTDDTEETAKRAGLRQVHILRDEADSGLRGTRQREYLSPTGCLSIVTNGL